MWSLYGLQYFGFDPFGGGISQQHVTFKKKLAVMERSIIFFPFFIQPSSNFSVDLCRGIILLHSGMITAD